MSARDRMVVDVGMFDVLGLARVTAEGALTNRAVLFSFA